MSVNRSIPALYQGVSQQPAAQRALEQVEALENGYVTVADGDRKRPPTQFVKHLDSWTPNNAQVHQYFRGDGEHNVIVIADGTIKVFDGVTGNPKTVDTTSFPGVLSYINSSNSMDDIGLYTVADTTFIWNRTKIVGTLPSTITAQTPQLFVAIKEARPDSDYYVRLGTNTVHQPTTSGAQSSFTIATNLAGLIMALPGTPYQAFSVGNLLVIRRTDNTDFTFDVYDSQGSTLMYGIKNRVERYSDLPRYFVEDCTVEVRGEADASKTAFWVKFVKDAGTQIGHWEETVRPMPGEITEFDATTLPVTLVRNSDGTFILKRPAWAARLVGSTAVGSAPIPSFNSAAVNSMFIHRGRLGILSGENIILSRVDDLFNFWPKTVTSVLDTDPIDGTANSPKVSVLRHAAPFQRQLVLFSDAGEFILTGGTDALTPKNARIDPATEYDCSALVGPVSSGSDLYFVFERSSQGGTFSGVREYSVAQNATVNTAVDITAHVPQYIPRHVHTASVSSTEDLLLLVSKEQWNSVYWYKYLWSDDKKLQSAWGRWTFRPSDKIISATVEKTSVHFVIQRVDGLTLEKMDLWSTATTGGLPLQVMLDSLDSDNTPGRPYDGATNTTLVVFNQAIPPDQGEVTLVAGADFGTRAGARIQVIGPDIAPGGYRVRGDWRDGTIHYGVTYAHRTTLSEQFMRDKDNVAIQRGRLQLMHLTLNFKDAVTFRVEVTTPGRELAKYTYTALQLGVIGTIIGAPVMRSGSWTCPIGSKSDRASITIVNDSPYPGSFYSAEWEGLFTTRSPRQ